MNPSWSTVWGRDKMANIFETSFSDEIFFYQNITANRSTVKLTLSRTDLRGGLVPNRPWVIIWTNTGLVSWRMHASLVLNTLNSKVPEKACDVQFGDTYNPSPHIDGLMKDCDISIAVPLDILQSRTKLSTCVIVILRALGIFAHDIYTCHW